MEAENVRQKAKRVRLNPTKKWTAAEEQELAEYLVENRPFEKPTAQAYYKRFLDGKKIDVEWKVVRAKVRNMRTSYNKTKSWECSIDAGGMKGETIKVTLLKMCPFFYQFEEVFGSRFTENVMIDEGLESFSNCEVLSSTSCFSAEELSEPARQIKVPSTSRKGIYSTTAMSDLMVVQGEMIALRKEKIEQDRTIKEKELALKQAELRLKEKELDAQIKLRERELELKEKEILSKERIKMKELEVQKSIETEKLKLQYK